MFDWVHNLWYDFHRLCHRGASPPNFPELEIDPALKHLVELVDIVGHSEPIGDDISDAGSACP